MIPIANLYYLLCYAWDLPPNREFVRATAVPFRDQPDFFAHLLIGGTERLLKRGPERGYTTRHEETTRPRGKLDLAATLKRQLAGTIVCEADELTHDTPRNRILKATLRNLARCPNVKLSDRCHALARRFADVTDIELSASAFAAVRSTHEPHTAFLLHVCRLLFENQLPNRTPGAIFFADFTQSERQMAALFERFVRNFYRREQTTFARVTSERFAWRDVQATPHDLDLLPELRTDVTLSSPTRKLLIDAKFYRETLRERFDTRSLHASHLYQLLAYLQNQRLTPEQSLEGLLLYPTVDRELDLHYTLHGFRVRVATVDLNIPWPAIHTRMLELLIPSPPV